MKEILVGSDVFFAGMPGFHDNHPDITSRVYIDDNPTDYEIEKDYMEDNIHKIRWRNMSKEDIIKFHMDCYKGRYLGKFLVPEYAETIGLTIDDLKKLKHLSEWLDYRHTYEKIIYDSYIENNGFFLTEEQKNKAYEDYKRARQ